MEEKDFDSMMHALYGELHVESDRVEENARSIAHLMWCYYKSFLLEGFDPGQAMYLTIYVANTLIFNTKSDGKS